MALTNTGWPAYTQEEVDAVAAVLASNRVNYWTGDETRAFEREFAEWAGSPCAIALTNGTVALDLALEALGIGPGDEVVVTPRTFIASISTVVNAGATPVFADVGADSGNITPETISAVLTPRTRAIIPVHLGGWPCDMPAIMALAARADIKVVEDCAQAHGARIDGQSVGSFGHVGAWSFCQDKIMTTGGEGGMVTTADEALWSRMWSYKDHGKDWEAVYNTAHPPGFRWLHNSFGTNWRMLEMQAVIGRIQLRRMAEWTRRRTEIAGRIAEVLRRYPEYVRVPAPQPGTRTLITGSTVMSAKAGRQRASDGTGSSRNARDGGSRCSRERAPKSISRRRSRARHGGRASDCRSRERWENAASCS